MKFVFGIVGLTLILAVFALVSGCRDSTEERKFRVTREKCESDLDSEIARPSTFAGQDQDSDLIANHYVPGMKRAKGSLDRLERGDLRAVPILAYSAAPRENGHVWLQFRWLQRQRDPTRLFLSDAQGMIGEVMVPSAGNPYLQYDTFMIGEYVQLIPEFSSDEPDRRTLSVTIGRQIERDSLTAQLIDPKTQEVLAEFTVVAVPPQE